MVNEIIKGISMKLNAVFGEGYEIYQNDVEQGLTEPCFFVSVLKPEVSPLLGQRAMRRTPLVIQYFPVDPGDNKDMLDIAERLWEGLQFITLLNGDMLHGTDVSYEIANGVLHFFISFNFPVISKREQSRMGNMKMKTGLEKGGVK